MKEYGIRVTSYLNQQRTDALEKYARKKGLSLGQALATLVDLINQGSERKRYSVTENRRERDWSDDEEDMNDREY